MLTSARVDIACSNQLLKFRDQRKINPKVRLQKKRETIIVLIRIDLIKVYHQSTSHSTCSQWFITSMVHVQTKVSGWQIRKHGQLP